MGFKEDFWRIDSEIHLILISIIAIPQNWFHNFIFTKPFKYVKWPAIYYIYFKFEQILLTIETTISILVFLLFIVMVVIYDVG